MGIKKILKYFNAKRVVFYSDVKNNIRFYFSKLFNKKSIITHYARVNNFGDQFNKDLVNYFGYNLLYTKSYKNSKVALTGSILGSYGGDFKGYILGAGFLRSKYDRKENSWRIKIIRGPLSAEQCGYDGDVFGDPGILANKIYKDYNVTAKFELGILPHSKDLAFVKSLNLTQNSRVKIISPRQKPSLVAKEILACKNLVSSSLHGLIFSDSFQIPNLHVVFSDKVVGGYHKFDDYYKGLDSKRVSFIYNKTTTSVDELINSCSLRISWPVIEKKQNEFEQIFRKIFHEISI